MCKKLMFLVCVIAIGLVSSASAVAVDLKCDAGDGALQAGWTRITMGTTNVGGISVTLSHGPLPGGSTDSRVTGLGSGPLADVEDDFYFPDNCLGSPDADMTLTLSGMDAGAYMLHGYHNDPRGVDHHKITSVTVTGATDVTTPTDTFQNHDIMSEPLEILFTYGGSGNVVITYHAMPGGGVYFNGFELQPAGPSVPTVQFDSASSGAVETVSPAVIDLVLSEALGEAVTVDYAASGGTAAAGQDYVMAGAGPACWGSPTQCHGDTDNDGDVKGSDFLAFKASWYKCDPEPGYDACADFDRDGCVKGSDFLIFKSNWYQAVEANCPSEGGSATLEFAPGETSKSISIGIIDDGLDEEDETIIVQLSNPAGPNVVLGEPNQHVYTIEDPRPAVGFEKDSSSGREDVSPVNVTVNLSFAATNTVTVDYAVTGGTATGGGVDYTLDAGTLTFNAGETTKTISIAIVNDGVDEQNETIVVELSNPSNAKLGDLTEFTYTIIDPSSLNLKIDFALPVWEGSENVADWDGVPIPETLKEGWIPWCAGRWSDMYGHGGVAMENIAGTGVSTLISTVYGGLSALKVCGMCMPSLNGGAAPYGSPSHDPICNSWYQVEDHIENPSGDIVMALYNLPFGEYELYSYHNNFECHRNTPACCDLISNPQPNMPSVTALSLTGLLERYAEYEWWPRWLDPRSEFINCMPQAWWDHPVGSIVGDNVTMIQGAYNVPIQQVTQDSQLVPSLIRFHTDGSAVFIVYKSGCCVHDGIRPARTGGRAILNAFELTLVGP